MKLIRKSIIIIMKLYSQETAKSLQNFPKFSPVNYEFIRSIIIIKKAAASANYELKTHSLSKLKAINKACDLLLTDKHKDQFVTDSMQGGAGTSINMNVNEVIARLSGLHPLDDINKSQSTNDVLPTALRLTLLDNIKSIRTNLKELSLSFGLKTNSFSTINKVGRTHLQDAVPMRLGQEWNAYKTFTNRALIKIDKILPGLLVTNLGGTAIGTGIGAPKDYAKIINKHLSLMTGYKFIPSKDLVDATQNIDPLVTVSNLFSEISGGLSKIASDLRLLGSGPKAGISELKLPEVQKGSSIMPGKVNPVILEYVNQIAFDIIGKAHTVQLIHLNGQLELNVYFPLLAKNLMESAILLNNALAAFSKYILNIKANKTRCEEFFQKSVINGVERAVKVGYEKSEKEIKSKLNQK